jgi:hypothetical protein
MILYRFFSAEYGLRTLETGLMRVGRFRDFNDPFEFMPQNTELRGNESLVCEFHRQAFIDASSSRYGIICFSEEKTVTKPLLWSHYADSHRGLAIGFKVSPLPNGTVEFEGSSVNGKRGLTAGPVIYDGYFDPNRPGEDRKNLRVRAEEFDMLAKSEVTGGLDLSPVLGKTSPLMFHKGEDWNYECEWRANVALSCVKFLGGHHFIDITKFAVARIVLGMRSPFAPLFLQEVARKFGADILVAAPSKSKFELELDSDP